MSIDHHQQRYYGVMYPCTLDQSVKTSVRSALSRRRRARMYYDTRDSFILGSIYRGVGVFSGPNAKRRLAANINCSMVISIRMHSAIKSNLSGGLAYCTKRRRA